MNKYFLIGTVIASILTFLAFLVLSILNYRKKMSNDYHIRNYFPYELNYDMSYKANIAGNALLVLSVLCYASSFAVSLFNKLNGFYIAIFVMGILASLIPLALVFTPLNKGKIHIIMVSISFFLGMMNAGLIAVQCYALFKEIHADAAIGGMVIAIIIALIIVFMMLNPKLSKWANMDTKKNSDGTISYIRPRYFVLAFTEWILIILNYCSLIPLIIMVFSI